MGIYLNPGSSGFEEIIKTEYVDKTGLISLINDVIGTKHKLICVSRPRRFGKSYAAQMLCAYYDKTCNSERLFIKYDIAEDRTFKEHLNKYDVIYLDMTNIIGKTGTDNMLDFIQASVSGEIRKMYPDAPPGNTFDETLINTAEHNGNKFIIIIDEWDAPIREIPQSEREYLSFLRMLFKSSSTTSKIFAAAYMTGILPVTKDGSQSAISEFDEYTMVNPYKFGKYTGFSEDEVMYLCDKYDTDFHAMKYWYDGYTMKGAGSVYNPSSVIKAIMLEEFNSYWTETSAAEGLMGYISKDYSGMAKTIAELIAGMDVKVDTAGFANDLVTFKDRDDVLTLMIHLGYLSYNSENKTVRIPNEEIRREFSRAVRNVDHSATLKRLEECDRLFEDTINGNEEAVAAQIEKIHAEETAPLHYNREESLRSVIKLAYYTYRDNYIQLEELPSGTGCADIVYLPKPDSGYPALVIELKWNKSAGGAIQQILDKKYPDALKNYGSEIILVGVNYDRDAPAGQRKHECRIIKL